MVKNTQKLILSSNMYPNYPMKTLDSNSEKVGVSWSEGLSKTVIVQYLDMKLWLKDKM